MPHPASGVPCAARGPAPLRRGLIFPPWDCRPPALPATPTSARRGFAGCLRVAPERALPTARARPAAPGAARPEQLLGLREPLARPRPTEAGGFPKRRAAAGRARGLGRASPGPRPARRGALRHCSGKSFPFEVCSPGPMLAHTPPARCSSESSQDSQAALVPGLEELGPLNSPPGLAITKHRKLKPSTKSCGQVPRHHRLPSPGC